MKARIVAFTNLFPRPWEPQRATFNRQQLERLAEQVDVEVLVPISWLDWLKARYQGLETRAPVSHVPTRYFTYFYLPKLCRWSYGTTLWLSTLPVIPRLLGVCRPSVIYAPWGYPDGLVMVVWGKLLGIPVVVKVLGTDINELPTIPGVRPQLAWALKQAAAVVAVSQDLANKVIALGAMPQNTHVIYDGVDPTRFAVMSHADCRRQLGLDTQGSVIVYVGNLLKSKGCFDLLEGFAQLRQQRPDAQLVYVGSGAAGLAYMQERAAALGVAAAVKWVGTQPHEQVARWMGAANVVVLPSYNEGVPNVLLEAMACGRPIVATRVGGIPEVVPEFAGILIAPGEVAALVDALLTALDTRWSTDKILVHISQFTWARNIGQLRAVLDSATQS